MTRPFLRDSIVISYFLFSSSRIVVLTGFCSTLEMFLTFCKLKEFLDIVKIIKTQFIHHLWSFLKGSLYCSTSNFGLQLNCKIPNAFKRKHFRNRTINKHLHIKIPAFSLSSRTSCAQNKNNALPDRSGGSCLCLSWRSQTPPSNHSTLKNLHILNFEHMPIYPYSTRIPKGLLSPTGFNSTL